MLAERGQAGISIADAVDHLTKHNFNIVAALEEIQIPPKRGSLEKGILYRQAIMF